MTLKYKSNEPGLWKYVVFFLFFLVPFCFLLCLNLDDLVFLCFCEVLLSFLPNFPLWQWRSFTWWRCWHIFWHTLPWYGALTGRHVHCGNVTQQNTRLCWYTFWQFKYQTRNIGGCRSGVFVFFLGPGERNWLPTSYSMMLWGHSCMLHLRNTWGFDVFHRFYHIIQQAPKPRWLDGVSYKLSWMYYIFVIDDICWLRN